LIFNKTHRTAMKPIEPNINTKYTPLNWPRIVTQTEKHSNGPDTTYMQPDEIMKQKNNRTHKNTKHS